MSNRLDECPKGKNILTAIKVCLLDILNSAECPASAECSLDTLEYTEEFGIILASFTMEKSESIAFRQLAALILNRYVETHWSRKSCRFKEPEVTEAARAQIKSILPCGLNDPDSKMRTSVASTVAQIAYWDWPHNWPELFNILGHCISGDDNSVHGSMKVLLEFTKHVNPDNLTTVAPIIFSEVYRIFDGDKIYRSKIRAQALQIYITFCQHILSEYISSEIQYSLCLPTVPQFLERFISCLENEETDCLLNIQIIKAIYLLKCYIPLKKLAPYLCRIISRIWHLFQQASQVFHKVIINGVCRLDPIYDLNGELFSYENYTALYLNFFESCASDQLPHLEIIMKPLLSCLLNVMKITNEQRNEWINVPHSFIDDDFEIEDDAVSVRHKALWLFKIICEVYQKACSSVLGPVFVEFVRISEEENKACDEYWWKGHEATMFALGSIKDIVNKDYSNVTELNIPEFTRNALNHLSYPNLDFLVGRCLWLSGNYAQALAPPVMMRYLEVLQEKLDYKKDIIKILGMKTLICYHTNLPLKNEEVINVFSSYMPLFYGKLIEISQNSHSGELHLTLEAIYALVSISIECSRCTELIVQKVIPVTISLYKKHYNDRNVLDRVQSLISRIMRSQYENALVISFVPQITETFHSDSSVEQDIQQSMALEVLTTIIKHSKPPINDILLDVFPRVVECILSSTDYITQKNGGECLREYLAMSPDQICSFQNGEGLIYFLRVVSHLLDPNTPEKAAGSIGKLIITLIMKTGNLLREQIDVILKSVLSKLQRVSTLPIFWNLIIIFAYLFLTQMDAVINFLLTVPGPEGNSALEFVLTQWCNRLHLFYGYFTDKFCVLAICKLFHYIANSNDDRITDIRVLASPFNACEQTFTSVTCKIFKLVLSHYFNMTKPLEETSKNMWKEALPEKKDKHSDDDSKDDIFEESDVHDLPMLEVCLEEHLKNFIKTAAKSPAFPKFIDHLCPEEHALIERVMQNN